MRDAVDNINLSLSNFDKTLWEKIIALHQKKKLLNRKKSKQLFLF